VRARSHWFVALLGCALPSSATAQPCGDGVVDLDETCDLGIGNDAGTDCDHRCEVPTCGDGLRTAAEACDDGNAVPGDGCDAQCRDESEPQWHTTLDLDGELSEGFSGIAVAGDRIFTLHAASDAWQEFRSVIMAYDHTGATLWEKSFGVAPYDNVSDLIAGPERLFVVGRRFAGHEDTQAVVAVFEHDGTGVGESTIPEADGLTAIALGPDDHLFVGGVRRHDDNDLWYGRYDLQQDTLLWSISTPRPGDGEEVLDALYDPRHGLYFSGAVGREAFLVRLDPDDGTAMWEFREQPDPQGLGSRLYGLALAGDTVVAAGSFDRDMTREAQTYGLDRDGWLLAFSEDGVERWRDIEASDLPISDGFSGVAGRDDGGVVVVGYRAAAGVGMWRDTDFDATIIEFDRDGHRTRELVYDGPLHLIDAFDGVHLLDEDRVLVTGQTSSLAASDVGLLAEFALPAPVPTAEPPAPPPPTAGAPQTPSPDSPHAATLYLDFDGAAIRPGSDGRNEEMPCVDGTFDYPGLDEGRAYVESVVQQVEHHLAPFDVQVVWEERPAPGLPYSTVLVGGSPGQLGFDDSTNGYSCTIDCENGTANELVLAFESTGPVALAHTIVHEAGHAWGLDHVMDEDALMSPFAPLPETAFLQRCSPLSDATGAPACTAAHQEYCPNGGQDGFAELLARFGPQRADITAPSIEGLPQDGVSTAPGEPIILSLALVDDSNNAGIELHVPSLQVRKTLDPHALDLEVFLPEGEHALEFVARDHAGNETLRSLQVSVVPSEPGGDADPETNGDMPGDTDDVPTDAADPSDSAGCGCRLDDDPRGAAAMGLLLLLLGRQRRRSRGVRESGHPLRHDGRSPEQPAHNV